MTLSRDLSARTASAPRRRRPRTGLVAAVAVGALSLSGCAALGLGSGAGADTSAAVASTETPVVAAAFYPLAWVAQRVVGDDAEVLNLTTPGAEPHDLEIGVKQTADIGAADLVVHLEGFQPAVDAAVAESDDDALDVATAVELEPFEDHGDHEGEDHEGEEHEDHGDLGELNPHFWQDPLKMAALADALGERMAAVDPTNATTYRDNAAATVAELEDLDTAYAEGLATCTRDLVVVNHDAFGYLSRYGLEFEAITGFSPDAEPTAGDLASLQELIGDDGVTTVFYERLVSPATARSLAGDTGTTTDVLDPIEGLTTETQDEDYLSLMRANLEALQRANGC